jgi:hypothetical protein
MGDPSGESGFWGWCRKWYLWLRDQPDFVKRIDRWGKPDPSTGLPSKASPHSGKIHVLVEGRKVEVDVSGSRPDGDEAAKKGTEAKPDPLGTATMKFLGAAAAGVGTVSAIVAVGAAVLWIRFNEAGIPAMQAVSVQPKYEALVQGGQQTAIFLFTGLVAVLLMFFTDPGGRIRRVTIGGFAVLFLLAVSAAVTTHLPLWGKVLLIVVAALLLLGCAIVGLRTQRRFWPLGIAVFVASLVFSSVSALLIAQNQDFVQAVAVLRGPEDAGLKGVYVAATPDTIYIARPTPIPTDERDKMAMMNVPREGVTYAVGPPESREKARQRARVMLARLVENSELNPEAAPEEEAETETEPTEEGEGAEAETTKSPTDEEEIQVGSSESLERVLRAFDQVAVIGREVARRRLCLVRYGDASSRPYLGKWWTSCGEAKRLATIEKVRERLALPNGRFQDSYDMRIEAVAPVGTRLLFVQGRAAPQCEHDPGPPCGREFPGGGVQFYVFEPQRLAIRGRECTLVPEDDPSEWGPCRG